MAKEQTAKPHGDGKQAKQRPKGREYDPRQTKDNFGARLRGWLRNAGPGELTSMGAAPFIVLFVIYQHQFGIPTRLEGFGFVFLIYYSGYFFLMLTILDRRLDNEYIRLGRGSRRQKIADILMREEQRKATIKTQEAADTRNEQAMERGRQKAADHAAAKRGKNA